MNLIKLLKRPARSETDVKYWIKTSFLFGGFVFLFLYLFRPFEIGRVEAEFLYVTLIFGAITTASMLLLNTLILPIVVGKVTEEKWTVGIAILWTLVHIVFIAGANSIYFSYTFFGGFVWANFLWFLFPTFMVSVFPVSLVYILQERRDSKKYETESAQISDQIIEKQKVEVSPNIIIHSKNVNEDVTLQLNQLLYLKSDDNYIAVYHLHSNEHDVNKVVIRNTLSKIANDLSTVEDVFHCHRSYLVNLKQVEKVSGNAQGFKLHLYGVNELIPVSRKHNTFIKKYFA